MNINRVSNQPKFTGAYTCINGSWRDLIEGINCMPTVSVEHIRDELRMGTGVFLKIDSDKFMKDETSGVKAVINQPVILTNKIAELFTTAETPKFKDIIIKSIMAPAFKFKEVKVKEVTSADII